MIFFKEHRLAYKKGAETHVSEDIAKHFLDTVDIDNSVPDNDYETLKNNFYKNKEIQNLRTLAIDNLKKAQKQFLTALDKTLSHIQSVEPDTPFLSSRVDLIEYLDLKNTAARIFNEGSLPSKNIDDFLKTKLDPSSAELHTDTITPYIEAISGTMVDSSVSTVFLKTLGIAVPDTPIPAKDFWKTFRSRRGDKYLLALAFRNALNAAKENNLEIHTYSDLVNHLDLSNTTQKYLGGVEKIKLLLSKIGDKESYVLAHGGGILKEWSQEKSKFNRFKEVIKKIPDIQKNDPRLGKGPLGRFVNETILKNKNSISFKDLSYELERYLGFPRGILLSIGGHESVGNNNANDGKKSLGLMQLQPHFVNPKESVGVLDVTLESIDSKNPILSMIRGAEAFYTYKVYLYGKRYNKTFEFQNVFINPPKDPLKKYLSEFTPENKVDMEDWIRSYNAGPKYIRKKQPIRNQIQRDYPNNVLAIHSIMDKEGYF